MSRRQLPLYAQSCANFLVCKGDERAIYGTTKRINSIGIIVLTRYPTMEQTLISSPSVRFAMSSDDSTIRESTAHISPPRPPQNTKYEPLNRSLASYTPIFTPKAGDRSGSIVLLSPSRTIAETLTALATQTGNQLEEVWDEVGYSPEDRASQLSDLLVKIQQICEQKIAEERGVAETFRQTIAEAKEDIQKTATALKTFVDPYLLQENTDQTLSDELATLESTLEKLRNAATEAREDLKSCLEYIAEAHEALGLTLHDKWLDVHSDLTAQRREEFHRKKMEMREELSSRTSAVIQLVRDCQQLMSDLKIEPEMDGSEIDRRIAGSLVRSKDGSFILASKYRSESSVGLSALAVEELTTRLAELHREKRQRKEKLQVMGSEIAMLWEKLQIPEEDQIAFTESVQGLGMDTIEKGIVELNRLESLKSRMLGKLVRDVREDIVDLWNQMNISDEQRAGFKPFYVESEDLFNDELLDHHDEYLRELQSKLEKMKPILRLIERREIIIGERFKYEELQKDPERLQQRGAAMARQLMEEEKMARRIKKELPKLTSILTEDLIEWKNQNGEDFQYNGEIYLETMARQEDDWEHYKSAQHELKKKKKEEEKILVENQYGPIPKFIRQPIQKNRGPLKDAQGISNARDERRHMSKV